MNHHDSDISSNRSIRCNSTNAKNESGDQLLTLVVRAEVSSIINNFKHPSHCVDDGRDDYDDFHTSDIPSSCFGWLESDMSHKTSLESIRKCLWEATHSRCHRREKLQRSARQQEQPVVEDHDDHLNQITFSCGSGQCYQQSTDKNAWFIRHRPYHQDPRLHLVRGTSSSKSPRQVYGRCQHSFHQPSPIASSTFKASETTSTTSHAKSVLIARLCLRKGLQSTSNPTSDHQQEQLPPQSLLNFILATAELGTIFQKAHQQVEQAQLRGRQEEDENDQHALVVPTRGEKQIDLQPLLQAVAKLHYPGAASGNESDSVKTLAILEQAIDCINNLDALIFVFRRPSWKLWSVEPDTCGQCQTRDRSPPPVYSSVVQWLVWACLVPPFLVAQSSCALQEQEEQRVLESTVTPATAESCRAGFNMMATTMTKSHSHTVGAICTIPQQRLVSTSDNRDDFNDDDTLAPNESRTMLHPLLPSALERTNPMDRIVIRSRKRKMEQTEEAMPSNARWGESVDKSDESEHESSDDMPSESESWDDLLLHDFARLPKQNILEAADPLQLIAIVLCRPPPPPTVTPLHKRGALILEGKSTCSRWEQDDASTAMVTKVSSKGSAHANASPGTTAELDLGGKCNQTPAGDLTVCCQQSVDSSGCNEGDTSSLNVQASGMPRSLPTKSGTVESADTTVLPRQGLKRSTASGILDVNACDAPSLQLLHPNPRKKAADIDVSAWDQQATSTGAPSFKCMSSRFESIPTKVLEVYADGFHADLSDVSFGDQLTFSVSSISTPVELIDSAEGDFDASDACGSQSMSKNVQRSRGKKCRPARVTNSTLCRGNGVAKRASDDCVREEEEDGNTSSTVPTSQLDELDYRAIVSDYLYRFQTAFPVTFGKSLSDAQGSIAEILAIHGNKGDGYADEEYKEELRLQKQSFRILNQRRDQERLETLHFDEEERLRQLESSHNKRKVTVDKHKAEFDKLCSQPIRIVSEKEWEEAKKAKCCFGDGCLLCSSSKALKVFNPESKPVVPAPSFKLSKVNDMWDSSMDEPTELGSRSRRSRRSGGKVPQALLMLNEMQHTLRFIEDYNKRARTWQGSG